MQKPYTVREDKLQIVINGITDTGFLPLTVSDLKGKESLTILLKESGTRYLAMQAISGLIDMRDREGLTILRDLLFSLPLEKHAHEQHHSH